MNKQTALQLLQLGNAPDKAQIKAAYIQQINAAEDRIDDARTADEEDQAWSHYTKVQQARSVLLQALKQGAPSPDESASEDTVQAPPPITAPTPMDAERAYLLLGLEQTADKEQVQQAYQNQLNRLDEAIDQTTNPVQAEPLWEQHKQIQQARYLLLHHQAQQNSNETSSPSPQAAVSKKELHAFALLGVSPDSTEAAIRKAYNEKIYTLEDHIDDAATVQEEDQLWEEHRKLQRAFSIANGPVKTAAPSAKKEQITTPPMSPHKVGNKLPGDSVEDFVRKQKRGAVLRRIAQFIFLLTLLGGAHYAWQQGYIQQVKDWLLPPPSPEELAAQAHVVKLQQEVKQLRLDLEQAYDTTRQQALDAANADSSDYPRLVRLRDKIEKKILGSGDFIKAKQLEDKASDSIDINKFIAAEAPLLDAQKRYKKLHQQLASYSAPPRKKAAPVKRRIPKPVVEPVSNTKEAKPKLPELNSAQKRLLPALIDIPAGSFQMGSTSGEDHEQPQHTVTLPNFKMGQSEVSVAHFRQFVDQTAYITEAERNVDELGCAIYDVDNSFWNWRKGFNWKNPGFEQTDNDPVVCLSWADVQAYLAWLRRATGWNIRLPSEAEWEYAARAGTSSKWFWGNELKLEQANCEDCNQAWHIRQTFPSHRFPANAFGLYSMPGNVWEWTEDCWTENYKGAPNDGSARLSGNCNKRVTRGGSWYSPARDLRSAARNPSNRLTYRSNSLGFRIAFSH